MRQNLITEGADVEPPQTWFQPCCCSLANSCTISRTHFPHPWEDGNPKNLMESWPPHSARGVWFAAGLPCGASRHPDRWRRHFCREFGWGGTMRCAGTSQFAHKWILRSSAGKSHSSLACSARVSWTLCYNLHFNIAFTFQISPSSLILRILLST